MSGTRIAVIAVLSMAAAFGLAALNLRVFPAFWSTLILESAQVDDAQLFATDSDGRFTGAADLGQNGGSEASSPSAAASTDSDSATSQTGINKKALSLAEIQALLAPVIYAAGIAELSGIETLRLRELAAYLKATPHLRLLITGYSTPSGGMRYNRFMASQRARVVRDRLGELGVPRRQLVTDGIVYTDEEVVELKKKGVHLLRADLRWFED